MSSGIAEHHKKEYVCLTRLEYRSPNRPNGVKAYTVSQESLYLLIQNVPSLGLTDPLARLLSNSSTLVRFEKVEDFPCEKFTEVYLAKYTTLPAARYIKKKYDDHVFYASALHISYAPEYESLSDTKEKLESFRRYAANIARSKPFLTARNTTGHQFSEHVPILSTSDVITSPTVPGEVARNPEEFPSSSQISRRCDPMGTVSTNTTNTTRSSYPATIDTHSVQDVKSKEPTSHFVQANPPSQHFCGPIKPFFPVPRQVEVRQKHYSHRQDQVGPSRNLLISEELLESTRSALKERMYAMRNKDQSCDDSPPKRIQKRRRI